MAKRTADNQKTKDDVEEEDNEEVSTIGIFNNRFLLIHDVPIGWRQSRSPCGRRGSTVS